MKNYTWLLLTAGLFTFACDGKDTGGEPEAGEPEAGEPEAGEPESEPEPIVNPYTNYAGWESLDYNNGTYGAGEYNCQLVWDYDSSSPVAEMSADCENCVFMFDVSYTLRDADYVYDDGTCLGGGDGSSSGTYGYSSSYGAYGPSWMFDYYGSYYWWGYADTFAEPQFTYYYGYKDTYYNGVYYTYYQYGSAQVTQ